MTDNATPRDAQMSEALDLDRLEGLLKDANPMGVCPECLYSADQIEFFGHDFGCAVYAELEGAAVNALPQLLALARKAIEAGLG